MTANLFHKRLKYPRFAAAEKTEPDVPAATANEDTCVEVPMPLNLEP
jgi:hypothetical protein